ncbi:hypothetical protein [Rubritalea tangerina]|uniref:hypothetical protein n=1 Tax=Rubritalea tangerina TaxID=430798 RepID=UPI0036141522
MNIVPARTVLIVPSISTALSSRSSSGFFLNRRPWPPAFFLFGRRLPPLLGFPAITSPLLLN